MRYIASTVPSGGIVLERLGKGWRRRQRGWKPSLALVGWKARSNGSLFPPSFLGQAKEEGEKRKRKVMILEGRCQS